jgi:DNA primase
MAVCPFHTKVDGTQEKTPSFAMSLSTGLFFCHACQVKGNIQSFLRNVGLSRDMIERGYRFLIDSLSTNIPPPPDALRPKLFNETPIDEAILGLFEYCPTELLQAGFTQQTLFECEVGWDQWHGRITYPLRDLQGKLLGISGRNPPGVEPKYKVYTKEYAVWRMEDRPEPNKRYLLWNADKVYPILYFQTKPEPLIVVEGFKACMWVKQAGFSNVVALLGSYASWEQRWIIERIGAPVYLFLDNNFAGRNGTIKAADSLKASMNVHVVEYPERLADEDKAQPDSCTPEEVRSAILSAPSYLQWLINAQ